ncbi:hypothetical protein PGQ11_002664 [Apiospora arundinis]|uniref:Uncharacterized protein n=1 Tax=Apiospora arundinis TaxID=335852 RepID=A0ABR2JJV2_9PEZI
METVSGFGSASPTVRAFLKTYTEYIVNDKGKFTNSQFLYKYNEHIVAQNAQQAAAQSDSEDGEDHKSDDSHDNTVFG